MKKLLFALAFVLGLAALAMGSGPGIAYTDIANVFTANQTFKFTSANPSSSAYVNGVYLDTADAKTSLGIGIYNSSMSGAWLQSLNEPATGGGTFALVLNPLGGSVGINTGTTAPSGIFDVMGTSVHALVGFASGGVSIGNTSDPGA